MSQSDPVPDPLDSSLFTHHSSLPIPGDLITSYSRHMTTAEQQEAAAQQVLRAEQQERETAVLVPLAALGEEWRAARDALVAGIAGWIDSDVTPTGAAVEVTATDLVRLGVLIGRRDEIVRQDRPTKLSLLGGLVAIDYPPALRDSPLRLFGGRLDWVCENGIGPLPSALVLAAALLQVGAGGAERSAKRRERVVGCLQQLLAWPNSRPAFGWIIWILDCLARSTWSAENTPQPRPPAGEVYSLEACEQLEEARQVLQAGLSVQLVAALSDTEQLALQPAPPVELPEIPPDPHVVDELRSPGLQESLSEAQAPDDSAFVPVALLLRFHSDKMSDAQCSRFLDRHPEIRQEKPAPNRRTVHVGDWFHHWQQQDRQEREALAKSKGREAEWNDAKQSEARHRKRRK